MVAFRGTPLPSIGDVLCGTGFGTIRGGVTALFFVGDEAFRRFSFASRRARLAFTSPLIWSVIIFSVLLPTVLEAQCHKGFAAFDGMTIFSKHIRIFGRLRPRSEI